MKPCCQTSRFGFDWLRCPDPLQPFLASDSPGSSLQARCPVCATPADPSRDGDWWSCPRCACRFSGPGHADGQAAPALDPGEPPQAGLNLAAYLEQRGLAPRPGRALTLGLAPAGLGAHLSSRGWEVRESRWTPAQFAAAPGEEIRVGKYQLLTLVGFFEQLADPLGALGKLRDLVADDGLVYLRLADHEVAGCAPAAAGPVLQHCLGSLLELLAQGGDRFALAGTRTRAGLGERELVLRPIKVNLGPGWDPRLEAFARSGSAGPGSGPAPRVPVVAIYRPGAIGDVIMSLNLIPALREKYPGHLIHYYCHRWIGAQLEALMQMAGVTAWRDMDQFQALPDAAAAFILQGYPLGEGFPRRPMDRHLIQYFARELGLACDGLPSLRLSLPFLPGLEGPYATLHPTARWSVYKNWPLERWEAVLRACPDIPVYQLGAAEDLPVRGARQDHRGAPLMVGAALLANARVHLGVDSFTNHLSHYHWNGRQVPSVILWGSSQRSATGYPHNVNLCLDLPCQPCFREDAAISMFPDGLGPCVNPPGQDYLAPLHACMHGIPVEQVAAELRRLWRS